VVIQITPSPKAIVMKENHSREILLKLYIQILVGAITMINGMMMKIIKTGGSQRIFLFTL